MISRLYDIHYHLFDLSHPNLLAFLMRDDLISENSVRKVLKKLPWYMKLFPAGTAWFLPGKITERLKESLLKDAVPLRNLLAVMEGEPELHFLTQEYYLLNGWNYDIPLPEKIILTPLIIDFGYKNLNNGECFYKLPPAKPVARQVADVLTAIRFYFRYEVVDRENDNSKLKIIKTNRNKGERLFEIYPFLGLNPVNYSLQGIKNLFDKYFSDYESFNTFESRKNKLFERMGEAEVNLEDLVFKESESDISGKYSFLFAGIKLYPPMGFNPWPEDDEKELEKVRFIYSECSRKGIPLTVHCSDSGFSSSPMYREFTDPSKGWQNVLRRPEFRNLRINFAHLGTQSGGSGEWGKSLIDTINRNRNVFTDCSCQTPDQLSYSKIKRMALEGISDNILFGTDFVINLLWSGSYNEYLYNFLKTGEIDHRLKESMAATGPERFLFGEKE